MQVEFLLYLHLPRWKHLHQETFFDLQFFDLQTKVLAVVQISFLNIQQT